MTLLLLLCGGFFSSALYQVPAVHQFDGAHLQRRLLFSSVTVRGLISGFMILSVSITE